MANTQPRVFISYSHDNESHNNWVLQLSTRLRDNGVDVILDKWNLTLGSNLVQFMTGGLSKSSRVICVCSKNYVTKANDGKAGTGFEAQIMAAEYITDQNKDWIIPLIRRNGTKQKVPTFLKGRMFIDFDEDRLYESKYEDLLRDLLDEPVLPIPPIGKNPFQTIKEFATQKLIPSSERYVSPSKKGVVTFDYSNNNGRYCIGQAELLFEVAFSKASDMSIHIYNDPQSIKSIAIIKDKVEIHHIRDARIYDSSSRVRTPHIGQIIVMQNKNGFYAAIKILYIKDDGRGAMNDEIRFEYTIQTNGSPDFSSTENAESAGL